jgi:hypothetical protein
MDKCQADFSEKEPCLNCCNLSRATDMVATGGDDGIVRVIMLSKDLKSFDKSQIIELKGA